MEARNLTQTAKFDNELHSVLDDAQGRPKGLLPMRKMLGWLPCRIRCRHDSSRSATPFTTRASRPGFKIKHALALRWMRHVPGSLPPKR